MIALPRRRFLTLAAGLIAAPAIVRASAIMPVKAIDLIQSRAVARIPDHYIDSDTITTVSQRGDGGWQYMQRRRDFHGVDHVIIGDGLPPGWKIIDAHFGSFPICVVVNHA